ncbi:hypothetical protein GW17_00029560, partial [Ensete ventricosum]
MEIGMAIVALCCVLDIPDVDGDRDFGIRSFSVRLGQEKVKSVLAVHQVTSNSIYRSPCGRSFIIKHISEETSDCDWPWFPCFHPLVSRTIAGCREQGIGYLILHVHLEGKLDNMISHRSPFLCRILLHSFHAV